VKEPASVFSPGVIRGRFFFGKNLVRLNLEVYMELSEKVNILSAIFGLLGALRYIFLNIGDIQSIQLEVLLMFTLASSSIPMSLILVFSGFYPEVLQQLNGLHIYYLLAGLSLLFVSIKTFFI